MKAILVLQDGSYFIGKSFGSKGEGFGEVVFNTCMTGYQEIRTDPSYNGQIVTMTYPLIGNYGFNDIDNESIKPHVEGFIVKESCDDPSNWRCIMGAEEYLIKHGIVGIKDIDTRALTKHIRSFGSMFGIISTECFDIHKQINNIKEKVLVKRELVKEVSTKKMYKIEGKGKKVAVIDFGIKENILRNLKNRDCDIYVFPSDSSAEEILSIKPDGILLSNGPGDPKDLTDALENIKKIIGKKPIMGICLGHQLLGSSLGGKTYKLKFGHHGGNHPVKDLITGRIYITSQNHRYALEESISNEVEITHINVNDGTIEGFRHKKYPILSIQYHPEAAPGPQDSAYVFDEFIQMMEVQLNA
ncbi:glutamine-hydrolyzing carbamoyl-phosphate synthase small subunit [Clostridium peptidivorans]|uniref:glutamine-hydrolyzing carbamoyl-phosphate synthase small subunit n=1 Tax=Clostridium peptidivorans TaxID=100174 RepID=UPI000BE37478|nr:glutamine-hydrolyzing carbamoyl-phosphate synthase small subunit [Clostridium peptidivorans]